MPTIGRYELGTPIGEGGMAAVWRARALVDGREVAVKLMRAELTDTRFREAFRSEVQLTARLNHPGIVRVFGWGELSDTEARELDQVPGTPWLAMELADRCLDPAAITSWAELRALAGAMLDALMHSHARGVIHRDLKPGNVLVHGDGQYLLTDFGIAFPNRDTTAAGLAERSATAGTMGYIAPEQVLGRWRDFGPYTDLFSLGIMLYQIATGTLLFDATRRLELGLQHRSGARLDAVHRFAVPDEFDNWIRNLVAYDPADRFAFAADAAAALAALSDTPDAVGSRADMSGEIPTMAWTSTPTVIMDAVAGEWGATVHIGGPGRAPVPQDWRPSGEQREHGSVGLELFGMRHAPMAGREAERDILWAQLINAVRESRAHGVILRGLSGVGKGRLGQWLCERAHELGVADSTRLVHVHSGTTIPEFLRQEFRLRGLGIDDAMVRLREVLTLADDDADNIVLERLLRGESVGLGEQTLLLWRLLTHFCSRRPVIVWLDDVHWSLEAIEAAARLTALEMPLLFLLTARDEDLRTLPIQEAQLEAYASMERVREVRLTPLGPQDMAVLLDDVLALEPAVRDEVVAHARGNPLIALQSLKVSIERGSITVDEQGRAHGDFVRQSTHDIWLRRLKRVVGDDQPAVLAAAILGHRVDLDLWQRLCASVGVDADVQIAHRLVESGLWAPNGEGWLFEHGSLRETILAEARGGRLVRDLHREAAKLFDKRSSQSVVSHGFHRIAAGDVDEGVKALVMGVGMLYAEGRALTARTVVRSLRQQLDRMRVTSQTMALLAAAEAGVVYESEKQDDALAMADELVAEATCHGWFAALAHAEIVRACVFESRRQLDDALRAASNARAAAHNAQDRELEERAACRVGWALTRANRHEEAKEPFQFVLNSHNEVFVVRALIGLGYTHEVLGEWEDARRNLEECARLAREAGRRSQLADALNSLAALAMRQGRVLDAVAHYEEAHENARLADTSLGHVIELNWAVALAHAGDTERARDLAVRAHAAVGEQNFFIKAYGHFVMLAVAAAGGNIEDWEAHAHVLKEPSFRGDIEFAETLVFMGTEWARHGDEGRSRLAFETAGEIVNGLDDPGSEGVRARVARAIGPT